MAPHHIVRSLKPSERLDLKSHKLEKESGTGVECNRGAKKPKEEELKHMW